MVNPNKLVKAQCKRCGSKLVTLDEDLNASCLVCGAIMPTTDKAKS